MATLHGIDVSTWQYTIDWETTLQYLAGNQAPVVIVRSSYGRTSVDDQFYRNWEAVQKAPIRGAYHYMTAFSSGVDQANHMASVVGKLDKPGDLPPIIDVEASGITVENVRAMAERLTEIYGRQPIIYTYPAYGDGLFHNHSYFTRYDLWIAHYGVNTPWIPRPWTEAFLWQYGGAPIPGILDGNTDVDVNQVLNWDTLRRLAQLEENPTPPPNPETPTGEDEDVQPFQFRYSTYDDDPDIGQNGQCFDHLAIKAGDTIIVNSADQAQGGFHVALYEANAGKIVGGPIWWGWPAEWKVQSKGKYTVLVPEGIEVQIFVDRG